MNVEELKARLRALLHQRDSLPLSRWIGLRDDALESLHLWRLLFSGHGLKDDKMFFGDYGLLDLFSRFFVVLLS